MSTIVVDHDLCTRCGICSVVCPAGIISMPGENTLPRVSGERESACLRCGHCEAFCPGQALLMDYLPDEKEFVPAGAGMIDPVQLGTYLKLRRSTRHFTNEPVPKEHILKVLDIARYAASGGNRQPVEWLVIYDPQEVRKVASLTIDWMRSLLSANHPMHAYIPAFIAAWEQGEDMICRGAPHLVIPHLPEDPLETVNGIIAMTYCDIVAPAFGIGTCWAGLVAGAALEHTPLKEFLALPEGRIPAYAMMFGRPRFTVTGIPRRKPLAVMWR